MSGISDFIEKWNESIEHFKMTCEFLENPSCKSVLDALESLLLYMGFDVDVIRDSPVLHILPSIPVQIMNIFKIIRCIHENIATSTKIFCVGDIYTPSPKRTLRILRELHNFALYYKVVTEEMQIEFNKRSEEKAQKRAIRDELTDRENSLAMELHNWNHKTERTMSKLPNQNEKEQLERETQEIMQDNEELDPRLKQCREELIRIEKEGFFLKEQIDVLMSQRVLNPEHLESLLNDVKMQSDLQSNKRSILEGDHKAKTEHLVKTIEAIEKWAQFQNVSKKNIEVSAMCINIKEECNDIVDQNDLEDLSKKYEVGQNTANLKKNELKELKDRIDAVSNKKKEQISILQRQAKELHEEDIEIQKYRNDSQIIINHVKDAKEQLQKMTKEQIQKKQDFKEYIDELISEINAEAYERCIKYKSMEDS